MAGCLHKTLLLKQPPEVKVEDVDRTQHPSLEYGHAMFMTH